jgi:hypothetical protein
VYLYSVAKWVSAAVAGRCRRPSGGCSDSSRRSECRCQSSGRMPSIVDGLRKRGPVGRKL